MQENNVVYLFQVFVLYVSRKQCGLLFLSIGSAMMNLISKCLAFAILDYMKLAEGEFIL